LEEPVALILTVEYKHKTLPQIVRTQNMETGGSSCSDPAHRDRMLLHTVRSQKIETGCSSYYDPADGDRRLLRTVQTHAQTTWHAGG